MEGFSYHNIFDTKGIEYVIILVFFAFLIPFWIILNKRSKKIRGVNKAFSLNLDRLRIPQGLLFNRNHTWMHLQRDGAAKIGLDDLLMHIAGPVKIQFAANPGSKIKKGDLMAEIEQDKKVLQVYSPLSGEVQKSNRSLQEYPEDLNNHPFREGWIYEIKPSSWKAETNCCYLAEEASKWMKEELMRFKDFVMESTMIRGGKQNDIILQDGGELRDHTLRQMPPEIWQDFQKNFLSVFD